jgi:uncharacterized protein (TIGR00251 family)
MLEGETGPVKNAPQNKAVQEVHLQPGAKSSGIAGFRDGVLYMRVTAPPHKGQANRAMLALIAQALGVSKSDVAITRGHTSRNKVLVIQGLSPEEVKERLGRAAEG